MANKDDVIELEGTVVESLPNTMFKVDIGSGHIAATLFWRTYPASSG